MDKEDRELFDKLQSFKTETYYEHLVPQLKATPKRFNGHEVIKFVDDCLVDKDIEIRKWRELVENLKLDHSIEMNKLKVKKEGEALKNAANAFDHLMKYMQCVESIVGFAGPIERVKQELDLIVGSRKDYLDYIDRARLGLCLVKEMIEDDKFDKNNALAIL